MGRRGNEEAVSEYQGTQAGIIENLAVVEAIKRCPYCHGGKAHADRCPRNPKTERLLDEGWLTPTDVWRKTKDLSFRDWIEYWLVRDPLEHLALERACRINSTDQYLSDDGSTWEYWLVRGNLRVLVSAMPVDSRPSDLYAWRSSLGWMAAYAAKDLSEIFLEIREPELFVTPWDMAALYVTPEPRNAGSAHTGEGPNA